MTLIVIKVLNDVIKSVTKKRNSVTLLKIKCNSKKPIFRREKREKTLFVTLLHFFSITIAQCKKHMFKKTF